MSSELINGLFALGGALVGFGGSMAAAWWAGRLQRRHERLRAEVEGLRKLMRHITSRRQLILKVLQMMNGYENKHGHSVHSYDALADRTSIFSDYPGQWSQAILEMMDNSEALILCETYVPEARDTLMQAEELVWKLPSYGQLDGEGMTDSEISTLRDKLYEVDELVSEQLRGLLSPTV